MPPPTHLAPSDGYLAQSRRPLASLVFVLPMIVLYEVGTWGFHFDPARHTERRIVAFTWLRDAFARLDATSPLLAPLSVVGLLLGWHVFSRGPWRVRPAVPFCMAGESLLLALPLLGLIALSAPDLFGGTPAALSGAWLPLAVLGIGAGVYEELLFRLLGLAVLHTLLADALGLRPRAATAVAVLITAVAFSAYHYLGGVPFEWRTFLFRAAAGIYLGVVFLRRGFGIAAGTHAAYDVLLVLAASH